MEMSLQLKAIQVYMSSLSTLAPTVASKKAFDMFQKVRIKSVRKREEDFFDRATSFEVPFDNEAIHAYQMGDENGELVFLVHGWESNAGSMSKIAESLVDEGKRVVLFNLPGHAFYKNDKTNLLICKRAFKTVIDHVKPSGKFSVVSHSFGSTVTAFALRDSVYEVDQLIFLTGPNRVEFIFGEFKDIIRLGDKAYNRMVDHTEKLLGEPISNISIANNLQRVNFDKLHLVHDKHDKILPFFNSEEIHAVVPNSEIIPFENIGHYRMLWNKEVIDYVTRKLGSESTAQ